MEFQPGSPKEVNPQDEMEVKREQEFINGGGEIMGSFKEDTDLLEKKEGHHLGTPSSRPMPMATSGPSANIPTPDQLTIFYGGSVVVFDGIPAEKVREIMLITAAAAAAVKPGDMKQSESPASTPVLTRSPSMQSTVVPQAQVYSRENSFCRMQAELPIARRHSLQRFFEKRRDRLVSKNPYPTSPAGNGADTKKPDIIAEASLDEGCFEEADASEEQLQPKVVANLA